MKQIIIILLAGLVLSSCKSRPAKKEEGLKGEISVSGAFALYPLVVKWADEFKQLHPGVRIDISAGGAGKGMTDALAKVVDLGMVSREVYPPEIERGAVSFAVAKDAVVPTINASNPALADLMKSGLTREDAIKLWITGEHKTWGDVAGTSRSEAVHVYTRSDACGAAETWALWLDKKQEDLLGTAVYGDPGLATAVQKDPLGIGLNNLSYAYDEGTRAPNPGLLVLPIDVNENGTLDPEELFYDTKDAIIQAIADDKYPSPPARDLYLVANGIPRKAEVIEFLKFILTKGQEFNVPAGYISLSAGKLQRGLEQLQEK
ncbi:MAG: PstS family phosphate ABC transporter substrate-binding protein [Odoribacteraceae bacterium]|jgi:phosphate transport system substrate-binding protein|nr:PstS family phosphate ABC transporter substrate-binding protein [Odoribacteraceae bacterium]